MLNESRHVSGDADLVNRREAISLALIGVLGLTSAAALYSHIVEQNDKFLTLLKDNPLTGEIAYAVGNQIKIIPADRLAEESPPTELFQVPRDVSKLIWLNSNEIIFIAQAHRNNTLGTPDTSEQDDMEMNVVSDGIFKLNRQTGESTLLFDPYSEAAKEQFGNVQQNDANEEIRIEQLFNQSNSVIKIQYGNPATFKIEKIVVNPEAQVYFFANECWYNIDPTTGEVSFAKRISGPLDDQKSSADQLFKLDSKIGGMRLTDGHADGISFEDWTTCAAWRHDK